jgi:hypothetical protein
MLKTILIIRWSFIFIAFVGYIVSLFMRVGKPVNSARFPIRIINTGGKIKSSTRPWVTGLS